LLKVTIHGVSIKATTVLTLDASLTTGGISNVPFVVRQAGVLVEELTGHDAQGNFEFVLQHARRVTI
jgi:hypothetical protein